MINDNKVKVVALWSAMVVGAGCQSAPQVTPDAAEQVEKTPTKAPGSNGQSDGVEVEVNRQPLERSTPAEAGLDVEALERLKERAQSSKSDALVVLKDGKVVFEWYPQGEAPGPIEAMSTTKSIVGLAVGILVDQGKVRLEQPVHEFFPQWNQGRKKDILVKHLLNHTSGLQADRNTAEIYRSKDFVALALAAELVSAPGQEFFYNNKAVNLLAGIIEKASGQRMDHFIAQALFAPLGIKDFGWTLDDAGNPHAMSGLQLSALDMARIGQLVLNKGRWGDQQVVSERWIEQSLARGAAPSCGLLWWRNVDWRTVTITPEIIERWEKAGVDPQKIKALEPMFNKPFGIEAFGKEVARLWKVDDLPAAFQKEMWSKGVPNGKWEEGPRSAYNANGYLGQYIYIEPHSGLVGVRQMAWQPEYKDASKVDGMNDFMGLMRALVAD